MDTPLFISIIITSRCIREKTILSLSSPSVDVVPGVVPMVPMRFPKTRLWVLLGFEKKTTVVPRWFRWFRDRLALLWLWFGWHALKIHWDLYDFLNYDSFRVGICNESLNLSFHHDLFPSHPGVHMWSWFVFVQHTSVNVNYFMCWSAHEAIRLSRFSLHMYILLVYHIAFSRTHTLSPLFSQCSLWLFPMLGSMAPKAGWLMLSRPSFQTFVWGCSP